MMQWSSYIRILGVRIPLFMKCRAVWNFTPNDYKDFVKGIFGDKVNIVQAMNYLQDGYTNHLSEKIEFTDESGNAVTLPDSTFFMVLEKR